MAATVSLRINFFYIVSFVHITFLVVKITSYEVLCQTEKGHQNQKNTERKNTYNSVKARFKSKTI